MADKLLKVGLVGANADYGWGKAAHVPAIAAVPQLTLHAVANRSLASAKAAAAAFGMPQAYDSVAQMARDPDIDIVAVATRAPAHRAAIEAALAAGKHVYCEWPLGIDLAEAEALARLARQAGTVAMIGLQGRQSPWLNQLRGLIADGYVGRVLSTTLIASDDLSTGRIAASNAYMLDRVNGANPLTIHGGHFLDSLCHVLGELADVRGVLATARPQVAITETGEQVSADAPDQIAVAGRLADGGVAAIQIRPGRPPGDLLRWEIQGADGFLRATCGTGYMHWRPLVIEGARGDAPPARLPGPGAALIPLTGLEDTPARHVAYAYAALASDIIDGTRASATFDDAVSRHRLIAAIEADAARA